MLEGGAVSPVALALAGGAAALLALGLRRRLRTALALGVGLLALAGVEQGLWRAPSSAHCRHRGDERPRPGDPFDAVLGYGPVPGAALDAREVTGGGAGFEGVYTIDARGLRVTPGSDGEQAVLFFGGSYTFGVGVADEDTLAWRVGELLGARGRAHNFGYMGYGPHQMLAALQTGRVEQAVDGRVVAAVFQLIPHHVRRVAGRVGWDAHGPRYALGRDGRAVRAGRFCDPPAGGSLDRSPLVREWRRRVLGAEVELCAAVVAAARDELARRFPGARFRVLFWDDPDRKSARLEAELRARGVEVDLVSDLLPGWAEDQERAWNSAEDHHPSAASHATLAAAVVDRVLEPGP